VNLIPSQIKAEPKISVYTNKFFETTDEFFFFPKQNETNPSVSNLSFVTVWDLP